MNYILHHQKNELSKQTFVETLSFHSAHYYIHKLSLCWRFNCVKVPGRTGRNIFDVIRTSTIYARKQYTLESDFALADEALEID